MSKPKGKYVSIDPNNPEALGICDKTGFVFNRSQLVPQMEWIGNSLQPTGFLVSKKFADTPNEQRRVSILKEDPVPVKNPRLPQEKGFFTTPPQPISAAQRLENIRKYGNCQQPKGKEND